MHQFLAYIVLIYLSTGSTTSQTTDGSAVKHWDHFYPIADLPKLWGGQEEVTYDSVVEQLKDLKERLYDNVTKLGDNDIPPPRGSRIERNQDCGSFEIVTRVGIYLIPDRIVRMDVEQQSLTLLMKEVLVWHDEALQWSRDSSLPIEEVFLNNSEIWTPPIFASYVMNEEEVRNSGLVTVYSDGLCVTARSVLYTIPCSVAVTNFPFDTHTCSFEYAQLFNSHHRLFLSLILVGDNTTRVDKLLFIQQYAHLEWEGISASENLTEENRGLQYTITLQRQSSFYAIVLIFPTVLLNLLSLVVFTLPINNTERENFSLTLTLTYFVLVMIIVDTSPPTGNQIPKLGLYVIMCTVIVVATFGMSLILIELHEHKRAKKRKMSRGLFEFLSRFCCFDKCFSDYHHSYRDSYEVKGDPIDDTTLLKFKPNGTSATAVEREEFKWKLLAKVLNYVFVVITLIAHILLPCFIYLC